MFKSHDSNISTMHGRQSSRNENVSQFTDSPGMREGSTSAAMKERKEKHSFHTV